MAFNFPNSPTNGTTYTPTSGPTFEFYNGVWTNISSPTTGVDNAVNHDTEVTYLVRSGATNVLTAAPKLMWVNGASTLKVLSQASQTLNMMELLASDGTTVKNSFNPRGMLTYAGRVFYATNTAGAPTGVTVPNVADTGLLWYDTTNSVLKIWNGTAWVVSSSTISLSDNNVFTGDNTFTKVLTLGPPTSGNPTIQASGSSKSLVLAPTNAGSTPVVALTLSSTQVSTDLEMISNNSLLVTGALTSSIGIISTSTGTATEGNPITLRSNLNASSRYLKIYNEASSSGIEINAKNQSGNGGLTVTGATSINGGNFSVNPSYKTKNLRYSRIPGSTMYFMKKEGVNAFHQIGGITSFPDTTIALSMSGSIPQLTFTVASGADSQSFTCFVIQVGSPDGSDRVSSFGVTVSPRVIIDGSPAVWNPETGWNGAGPANLAGGALETSFDPTNTWTYMVVTLNY